MKFTNGSLSIINEKIIFKSRLKTVSFLHFSDTHLGIDLKPGNRKNLINHRSLDFQDNFNSVIKRSYLDDIDFIIHTGDLFDRANVPETTKIQAINELYKLSKIKPVFIIPGNHDKSLIDMKLFSSFSSLYVFNIPNTISLTINDIDINITGIPFFKKAQKQFLRFLKKSQYINSNNYSLLMLHQLIENSINGIYNYRFKKGNKEVILNKNLPVCDYIALGHIHRFQTLPKNAYYAGSTERTSFIEREETKGYIIGDIEEINGIYSTKITFIPLQTKQMIQLEFDYSKQMNLNEEIKEKLDKISTDTLVNCRVLYEEVDPQLYLYVIQNHLKKEHQLNHLKIYSIKKG